MYTYETADNALYDLLRAYADYNKQHPTDAERIVWDLLKAKHIGHKFRRQHIIKDYIVDFVCLRQKIVIEIDGQYHLEEQQIVKDKSRTDDLLQAGYKVIRFSNEEVIANPTFVLKQIKQAIMEIITPSTTTNPKATASPNPSKRRGEQSGCAVASPLPLEGLGEATPWCAAAWAVDAACSGNPGPMEYRAVDLQTGYEVFHFGPMHGTNNIGEFLAIVHALALMDKQGITDRVIYSDSYNAILWVKKKQCKTKLAHTPQTEALFQIIRRAEAWLRSHAVKVPILKWDTKQWGEVPADFGRK